MDVDVSEINRLKYYWTDFYMLFLRNYPRYQRQDFIGIEIFDPTNRKKCWGLILYKCKIKNH